MNLPTGRSITIFTGSFTSHSKSIGICTMNFADERALSLAALEQLSAGVSGLVADPRFVNFPKVPFTWGYRKERGFAKKEMAEMPFDSLLNVERKRVRHSV